MELPFNRSLKSISSTKKRALVFVVFAILFLPLLLFMFSGSKGLPDAQQSTTNPTITPFIQEKFVVTAVYPEHGQLNVVPGEIQISFTTDIPIVAEQAFKISISPALPYYWRFTNTFPAKKVTAQVYGNLTTNTQYSLTVADAKGNPVYTWSFTTADTSAGFSSGLMREKEKQVITDYYPLLKHVPYSNNNFSVDYTDRLTLVVQVKNKDVGAVKAEVTEWIRSKDVEPSTHTILYENAF